MIPIFLKNFMTFSTRAPAGTLCIRTLIEHSGRVFRLQFDEFQIVSSRWISVNTSIRYFSNFPKCSLVNIEIFSAMTILFWSGTFSTSRPLRGEKAAFANSNINVVDSYIRRRSLKSSNDLIVATRCSSKPGDRTYTYVSNFWESRPRPRVAAMRTNISWCILPSRTTKHRL